MPFESQTVEVCVIDCPICLSLLALFLDRGHDCLSFSLSELLLRPGRSLDQYYDKASLTRTAETLRELCAILQPVDRVPFDLLTDFPELDNVIDVTPLAPVVVAPTVDAAGSGHKEEWAVARSASPVPLPQQPLQQPLPPPPPPQYSQQPHQRDSADGAAVGMTVPTAATAATTPISGGSEAGGGPPGDLTVEVTSGDHVSAHGVLWSGCSFTALMCPSRPLTVVLWARSVRCYCCCCCGSVRW